MKTFEQLKASDISPNLDAEKFKHFIQCYKRRSMFTLMNIFWILICSILMLLYIASKRELPEIITLGILPSFSLLLQSHFSRKERKALDACGITWADLNDALYKLNSV